MIRLRYGVLLALTGGLASAQRLPELEKIVSEFSLQNGLHFIVAERHSAPVITFRTYVNAGSVDDPAGATGLAYLFERMAWKGTEAIGTKDAAAEKKALDQVEELYNQVEAERNKGFRADDARVGSLELQLKRAIGQADGYATPEFLRAVEEKGGSGIKAVVTADAIQYTWSLPSNRVELWFLLESQRLMRPSFREFYKERDALRDEIRARGDSKGSGRLMVAFPALAFETHPYRNPTGGWPADVEQLRIADAKAFFDRYFVPANMTIAMAGDVNPAEARRLAEKYFGPMPARPLPPRVHSQEPPQAGSRTAIAGLDVDPYTAIGYKRPAGSDRDDPVLDVMGQLLAGGRHGLLTKSLVDQHSLASSVEVRTNLPGARFPALFVILVRPTGGHSPEELQSAVAAELARLQTAEVDPMAFSRAKIQVRENMLAELADNSGLTQVLATYHMLYGDWRRQFPILEAVARVTPEDVRHAAIKYFVPGRCTMVSVTQPPPVTVTRTTSRGSK